MNQLLARSVEIIGPGGERETRRLAVLSFRPVDDSSLPSLYRALCAGKTVAILDVRIEPFEGECPSLLLAESSLLLNITSIPNLLKMP